MFINVEGVLRELPDDLKTGDKYEFWDNCICVYYSRKLSYSIYYNTDGLKLLYSNITKPEYYKNGYCSFSIERHSESVVLNCKTGKVIIEGRIKIHPHIGIRSSFNAANCFIFETCDYTYRMFDSEGNELLKEYVASDKKLEFVRHENFGNVCPVRLKKREIDKISEGILHIFLKENDAQVAEIIPAEYTDIELNDYEAYKDKQGRYHYPTYIARKRNKSGKMTTAIFDFSGKKIK